MKTPHLDAIDQDLLQRISAGLQKCQGVRNAITAAKMLEKLKAEGFKKANPVQIRKIIHYLRAQRLLLICGDTNGYYVAANTEEAQRQISSMLSRIREIHEACEGIQEMAAQQFSTHKQTNIWPDHQ